MRIAGARRALLLAGALSCGTLGLLGIAAPPGSARSGALPPASGAGPSGGAAEVDQGRDLFDSDCSACHGLDAQGRLGQGPDLHGVGELAAAFYLGTGRMPLPSSHVEPARGRPAYPAAEIAALVAYVGSFGGPGIPTVQTSGASIATGEQLFALNCAGCHAIQAQGGIVTGASVPSLNQATPSQIAEAIRIGPFVMPRFSAGELDQADVDDIARYVAGIQSAPGGNEDRGGWGIGRIGPVPEGMVAWLLALAAILIVARLIGERTPT